MYDTSGVRFSLTSSQSTAARKASAELQRRPPRPRRPRRPLRVRPLAPQAPGTDSSATPARPPACRRKPLLRGLSLPAAPFAGPVGSPSPRPLCPTSGRRQDNVHNWEVWHGTFPRRFGDEARRDPTPENVSNLRYAEDMGQLG